MTLIYKLYYKEDGSPKFYSMEVLEGDYIVVDQKTFESSRYDIKVIDGKIKSLSENVISKYHKVTEETKSAVKCDLEDISIIVDSNQLYNLWDYKNSN